MSRNRPEPSAITSSPTSRRSFLKQSATGLSMAWGGLRVFADGLTGPGRGSRRGAQDHEHDERGDREQHVGDLEEVEHDGAGRVARRHGSCRRSTAA